MHTMTTKTEAQTIDAALQAATRGRTPAVPAAPSTVQLKPGVADDLVQAQNELAVLDQQQADRVHALALQIGYEGSLTVGALEDEIRFYQRRTVEAILETGKRLRVLKEMTPHGEFAKRVELLGFSYPTAARFMQAAEKTAKSLKLRDLSAQVKNGSAFLELVTHDDDELKALDGMDDVDRMSASQLRAKFRESKAEGEAKEKLLADKNQQIDSLRTELTLKKNLVIAPTDWPERFKGLMDQAQFAHKNIKLQLSGLEAIRESALQTEPENPEDEASLDRARTVLADELLAIHRQCAEYLEALGGKFSKTLGGYASEGLWK